MRNKRYIVLGGIIYLCGILCGLVLASKSVVGRWKGSKKRLKLFEGLYRQTNQWLACKQQGKKIEKCLEKKGYHKIAIFGMGDLANRLYDELLDTGIEVVFEMDNAKNQYYNTEIYSWEDELPEVDAIIVTDFLNYENVKSKLEKKGTFKIEALVDILYEDLVELGGM